MERKGHPTQAPADNSYVTHAGVIFQKCALMSVEFWWFLPLSLNHIVR
jgi:hypothetical protein